MKLDPDTLANRFVLFVVLVIAVLYFTGTFGP